MGTSPFSQAPVLVPVRTLRKHRHARRRRRPRQPNLDASDDALRVLACVLPHPRLGRRRVRPVVGQARHEGKKLGRLIGAPLQDRPSDVVDAGRRLAEDLYPVGREGTVKLSAWLAQ